MLNPGKSSRRRICLTAVVVLLFGCVASLRAQTITNLGQLTQTLNANPRTYSDIALNVTVCAASRKVGVLIAQDDTGVELLQLGDFDHEIQPGERIRIEGWSCFLRRRETGIELSTMPLINNDGLHIRRTWGGEMMLPAGAIPIRLEWFNNLREFHLEVSCLFSNTPVDLSPSNFWHAVEDESGRTNFLPGLRAEGYEGYWEMMPNFDLLQPVKTGVVASFDPGFRTRDELVGVRYAGFFNAPYDGRYNFRVRSDDGSLLFLGKPGLPLILVGMTNVPKATRGVFGKALGSLTERRWTTIEGRVSFITKRTEGLELELRSDRDVISVWVTDPAELDTNRLLNARVRVTGVGRGVLTTDQRISLGKLCVASAKGIEFMEMAASGQQPLPIIPIGQVQGLRLEDARRALPVRVRGVVTDIRNSFYERRMSLQDDTRGIYVRFSGITNTLPVVGDLLEIEGHSGAGDFAPVIFADKITLLGGGRLPEPVRPTWTELLNGTLDVQWAELLGLVTAVQSNTITLLLPEGWLDIRLDGYGEAELKTFDKAIVRIRGVLYAVWNAQTHEVRVGSVLLRNATVIVDAAAPADPFEATFKTLRELLLFDAQATAFRRVKVRGQIVYADQTQMFLAEDGLGLRLLPTQQAKVHPGDLMEAVGYLDISRTALLLREVVLRKTGVAPLAAAKKLNDADLMQEGLDAARVRVPGQLLGWHTEQGTPVLEMQSGAHLYLARLAPGNTRQLSLRTGSRLALEGVYVRQGRQHQSNAAEESFQLLLNSPADIFVLSQPSWWTLPRLLTLVGVLVVILIFTVIWNTQLRHLVEQRTAQLQRETRERERVERQHALEAERSRIARDLHDDLGSSLTEISVLASTGQRPQLGGLNQPNLFLAIAGKARSLIAALDVIVWAVDPEDNSLQSLADYLSGYTAEFFSHTNISCRFKVPVSFPKITLEGRVRHDLLMAVKEALNNIVRHAEATDVEFRMAMADHVLEIEIADNGKGIGTETIGDGHGLKNQSVRLQKLGGTCAVAVREGGGTKVSLRLPLPSGGVTDVKSVAD
jgi:signal transduction histidine kinase